MPKISLIVCLYKERDLLERLLYQSEGCYDELIVIHDGPEAGSSRSNVCVPSHEEPRLAVDFSDPENAINQSFWTTPQGAPNASSIHELVLQHGGRFFEGPRFWQQEPHWPFAWSQARYEWILRLDSDEFPSEKLREYLRRFRELPEPNADISGYTCIWPYWDGKKASTINWPDNRFFLFHRQRVRVFGMVEQVQIPDSRIESLRLVLHHQPHGKRYGIRKVLFRAHASRWKRTIAISLLKTPLDLPHWRWETTTWPTGWSRIRERPVREAFIRLLLMPIHQAKSMTLAKNFPTPSKCIGPAIQHFLVCLDFSIFKLRRRMKI